MPSTIFDTLDAESRRKLENSLAEEVTDYIVVVARFALDNSLEFAVMLEGKEHDAFVSYTGDMLRRIIENNGLKGYADEVLQLFTQVTMEFLHTKCHSLVAKYRPESIKK